VIISKGENVPITLNQCHTRAIQQYLGHRNIQYTVRYTELAPHRFLDFWDD